MPTVLNYIPNLPYHILSQPITHFSPKITTLQKSKTTKKAEGSKEDDELPFEQSQITQAKRIMKPFVLRRLKRDVLQDLPKKTNHRELCPMSERQGQLYKNLIASFSATDGSVSQTVFMVGLQFSIMQIANG